MGEVVYQDVAIAVDVLKAVLAKYEAELLDSKMIWGRKRKVIMCGAASSYYLEDPIEEVRYF